MIPTGLNMQADKQQDWKFKHELEYFREKNQMFRAGGIYAVRRDRQLFSDSTYQRNEVK